MRLLDTSRLELIEVADGKVPEYAALSHTWGKEEVSLQEMQYVSRRWSSAVSQTASAIKAKAGYAKIKGSAALAAGHGYNYIWIDTCCIDKTSSAELSEAINSMFQWYKKAAICYAYLEDVKYGYHDIKGGVFHYLCQHSRWFTRGWTLQELIAPDDVMFYGADWGFLGSKGDEDVRISLAGITGVDARVLGGVIPTSDVSIATRMRWASRRETTRVEDLAYSLMGLFDVNMPLLYGEGTKAFIRLQEILKGSDDHSIFAWMSQDDNISESHLCGLLAESPAVFAEVENYRPLPPAMSRGSTAWTITNHGLRLSLFLQPAMSEDGIITPDEYNAVLECARRRGDGWSESPAIRLRRLYGDQFARVGPQTVEIMKTPAYDQDLHSGSYEVIFVKQKPAYAVPDFMVSFDNIRQPDAARLPSVYITGAWPEKYWDAEAATLRSIPSEMNRIVGLFRFHDPALNVDIDCAVGLQRRPDRAWGFWTLQRPSGGFSLHNAAVSANMFLAMIRNESVPRMYQDLRPLTWEMDVERVDRMYIRIRETYIHGRVHLFVKASAAMELTAHPAERDFGPRAPSPTEPPSPIVNVRTPLNSRLRILLMDLTISTSLRCGYLASEAPTYPRVRTAPHVPVLEEFEDMVSSRDLHGSNPDGTRGLEDSEEGEAKGPADLENKDPRPQGVAIDFSDLGPLHWAVIKGHLPVIENLLGAAANIFARTAQGWLPVHLAALFGRFTILNWLVDDAIKKGLQPWDEGAMLDDQLNVLRENTVHLAAAHISTAIGHELEALYRFLRQSRAEKAWLSPNCFGETPLHRLAAMGEVHLQSDFRMMEFFDGVSDALDHRGRNFLWHATCAGSPEKIEWLIHHHHANVSAADIFGISALHIACRRGDTRVAKILLLAGADPNARTHAPGLTPAHYAVIFNQPECLRLLLEHGADVTRPTNAKGECFRPIHLALWGEYKECVQILQTAHLVELWTCTHYIRRIPSTNDLCPFEICESNLTVGDLLASKGKSRKGIKRTVLSIPDPLAQDVSQRTRSEVKDSTAIGLHAGASGETSPYGHDPRMIPLPESPTTDDPSSQIMDKEFDEMPTSHSLEYGGIPSLLETSANILEFDQSPLHIIP
ncbi:hypothetical protein GQ53DRAFT_829087 [Thozetella sp. PMI_491]|nr:hypothetical protein GQ53DRAFT_829087 [Thozetella sp. PMI_491]